MKIKLFTWLNISTKTGANLWSVDYHSIPVISIIFYMTGIFMTDWVEIGCNEIFKEISSDSKERNEKGQKINLAHAWSACQTYIF
jgi:hypothetical protein